MQDIILTVSILHTQGNIAIGMKKCYTNQKLFKKPLENSVFQKDERGYFAN